MRGKRLEESLAGTADPPPCPGIARIAGDFPIGRQGPEMIDADDVRE